MSESRAAARLSVDIGGTFTDIVIEAGGHRTTAKIGDNRPLPAPNRTFVAWKNEPTRTFLQWP